MRRKKRFIAKLFIIFLVISLSILTVIISSKIIFEKMQNEQEMMNNYKIKKEKCELLKDIAKESIQEGVCIDTRKISNDEIQYCIYNDNESIIFYYYLQDDSTTEHIYNATIKLSNEYRILEKEYSIGIESLDEYIKSYNYQNRILSVLYGMLIVFAFYFLICILVILVITVLFLLKICIEKKNKKLIKNYSLGGKDTMNFFGHRYLIHGWKCEHVLTAKEIHKQIMADSKSDYNWIVPAKELVRICKKTSFPSDYALDIKIAILNSFANSEHRANCGGDRYCDDPEDKEAVQYCYNSLYDINNKEAIAARKIYLTEMIATASYISSMDPLYHPGSTFQKLKEDWRKSKFEEYISQEKIDFKQLIASLHNDFAEIIKKAEANGDFEEDEKKDKESWRMVCEILKDI